MMDCKKALQETAATKKLPKRVREARHQDAGNPHWSRDRGRADRRLHRHGQESRRDGRVAMRERAGLQQPRVRAVCQRHRQATGPGPGAKSADELLNQPSPSKPGQTLGRPKDDMFNRIREVFNLGRIVRIDGNVGAYAHHTGSPGVLVEVEGGTPDGQGHCHARRRRNRRRS